MTFDSGAKVKIGAEARIQLVEWAGVLSIRKQRVPKSYRDPKLDQILRTRRTKQEAEMIHSAKRLGVDSPLIYFIDPKNSDIIMEYIEGIHLKDADSGEGLSRSKHLYFRLGESCARLHSGGIIHGDLTTKNVIVGGERLVLIDFGLSFYSDRVEDKAEDIHLLKQALRSACPTRIASAFYNSVVQGYESIQGGKKTSEILEKVSEIEERGRYARVD